MIEEAIQIVDEDGTGEIDFDEFVKLMKHLRQSEGFTRKEIKVFKESFAKADVDGSGEISTLELGKLLRWLGYPTNYDPQCKLVDEVDVDGSKEIDFGEFLKLLRKYRNEEAEASLASWNQRKVNSRYPPGEEPEDYEPDAIG